MKKTTVLSTFILSAALAGAQPVITATNYNLVAGQTSGYYEFDTTGFDPGSGGAAVTWNFSSFAFATNIGISAFSPAHSPYAGAFPTATEAVSKYYGLYEYYLSDLNGQYYLGVGSGSYVADYSDPAKTMSYPFTYLSAYTDDFFSSFNNGSGMTTYDGEISVTADGYGTLTTPTGIYNNVLRVVSVRTYTEVTGSTTIDRKYTHYDWISPGTHFPLMTFVEYTDAVDGTYPVFGWYLDPAATTIGIQEQTVAAHMQMTVFPNPAGSGAVNIKIDHAIAGKAQVLLTNTVGQQVMSGSHMLTAGHNQLQIDVTQVPRGVYFVEVVTSLGKCMQKLVIS